MKIQRHGSYHSVNTNGFVIPIPVRPIQTAWQPIIQDVVSFYQENLPDNLLSIYVRGSVAKGEAVENLSDVDSFCVVKDGTPELSQELIDEFEASLMRKYHFCTGVEIYGLKQSDIFKPVPFRKRSVWEEIIKTQSTLIYGQDFAKEILPFTLQEMVAHSLILKQDLEKLESSLSGEDCKSDCTWIAKRVIRAGFDLVMLREQKYTRDLYLCYESFSKYYPEKSQTMFAILDLALNPTSDPNQLINSLNQICPWLLEQVPHSFED